MVTTEYRIATLADFEAVPADRLEACLEDFAYHLRLVAATRVAMTAAGYRLKDATFRWLDDDTPGVREVHINIRPVGEEAES